MLSFIYCFPTKERRRKKKGKGEKRALQVKGGRRRGILLSLSYDHPVG